LGRLVTSGRPRHSQGLVKLAARVERLEPPASQGERRQYAGD
jgi:hypothetical protein